MKQLYSFLMFCLLASASAQIITIPDANFKTALLSAAPNNQIASANMPTVINVVGSIMVNGHQKIDVNNDGEIQVSEAQNILSLKIDNKSISNLTGIEAFTNLVNLSCYNNSLSTINLTQNTNLKYLDCSRNLLTGLNISQNTNLLRNNCSQNQITNLNLTQNTLLNMLQSDDNQLTSLDVSQNLNLLYLDCSLNQLSSLDASNNTLLTVLGFRGNQIATIDVSDLIHLNYLGCGSNLLTNLNLTANTLLDGLSCENNQLTNLNTLNNTGLKNIQCGSNLFTELDFSHLPLLAGLWFENNPNLVSANLKNNNVFWDNFYVSFDDNPNLEYICADEEDLFLFESMITNFNTNTPNCHVNSYCSFTPGGTYYTIQGNQKLDSNNNGCDSSDIIYPNLKFSITNGTNTGAFIADNSGNYSIDVQAGTHTVVPILENPSYFNVTPASFNVSFPTAASPYNQDICIVANGLHNDLEIVVLPVNGAVPGFNATYKIVYKNKGTTTQSGSVNLSFEDAVLDFVSNTPNFTSQSTGNLTWNFTNLLPFESRLITVSLNLNSPTEFPALNSGDILTYTASINAQTDETPTDNTASLNQTLVNSYDPNDKSCLEGTTISPNMVGDYVHYLIRFENNGTANAQNIVVRDMIDTAKFDINSLVPTNASHSFVNRITNPNKVEFIFENINLPFDDAHNDGYVAFKIKTKPGLVVGSTFSNSANIYFDYNFPILTNTATTTVQALANADFEFSDYFTLSPNPAKDVLNIKSSEMIVISSLSIYNSLGQLVLAVTEPEDSIDVSVLKTGSYFIKVVSDKGTASSKFLKE